MRFFHDAEFHEDGNTIDLISYAMLAESGGSFYAVNAEADWRRISERPWLVDNVLPHLPGAWAVPAGNEGGPLWLPDFTDARVMRREDIAREVVSFVSSYGGKRSDHELWAWYGAYDHVALAQLFGPMINLPDCIPMHTNDLKTLVGERRVPDKLRGDGEHDALADCHFNRRLYQWISKTLAMLEAPRQLGALDAVWQGLSVQARADVHRLTAGTMLTELLNSARAVLDADEQ